MVSGERLPKAVKPTLRTSNTSSKNLSGISPVHSLLLFFEETGSAVVDSPVGVDQVFKKTAS